MPHNFRFIPLICAAIPEAKIVHVYRDPKATCWSNFRNYFSPVALGYFFDLRDIVRYYSLYKNLMEFWKISYSDRIIDLDYEKLVQQPDVYTSNLLEKLGLEFEKATLAPHLNTRAVATASALQVRKRIYKNSSLNWRKYKELVEDYFDPLGD